MRDVCSLILLTIIILSVDCTPYDPGMRDWQATVRLKNKDAGDDDKTDLSTSYGIGGQFQFLYPKRLDAAVVDPDGLNAIEDQISDASVVICELENATAKLVDGTCAIENCETGYGNCDGEDATGCEKKLDDTDDCGACGVFCSFENATATCSSGACALATCDEGFGDCNNDPEDGCETSLNTTLNCGVCDNICTTSENGGVTCQNGVCTPTTCDRGWDNCDNDPDTFCETRIDTIENCGRCGQACNSKTSNRCRNGSCVCGFIGGECRSWEWCCHGLCLPWPCLIDR